MGHTFMPKNWYSFMIYVKHADISTKFYTHAFLATDKELNFYANSWKIKVYLCSNLDG